MQSLLCMILTLIMTFCGIPNTYSMIIRQTSVLVYDQLTLPDSAVFWGGFLCYLS